MNDYNNNNNDRNQKRTFRKRVYKEVGRPFKKKRETLEEVITRRNERLKDLFNLMGISVRIIGNDNHPAIVYNEKNVLNCYVHNFELRFTDNPYQGNVIYTIKLTEKPIFDKNKVMSCINDYEMRSVTKVYLIVNDSQNPRLYLSGYNFLDKKEKLGRYPVFSAYNPKVYFTQENAATVVTELEADGYKVGLE